VAGAALLDVNVLVALTDPDHVHHELAHDWFAEEATSAWATCPLTENGFLRVLTNPGYHSAQLRPMAVVSILRRLRAGTGHQFWPDVLSLADKDRFDLGFVAGHRQLTDVYLLGLAHARGGALATFDRTIPVKAVRGATRAALRVIEP
jgi:toxin-antitoxin system PIN domain toxin